MERLLELGGDKKYLTFDDLNRELPDNVVSPDDIEDVLQKLEGSNIPVPTPRATPRTDPGFRRHEERSARRRPRWTSRRDRGKATIQWSRSSGNGRCSLLTLR